MSRCSAETGRICSPADTPFSKKLESLGVQCDNGLMMLLYQGIIAYEYWTGLSIDDDLADACYAEVFK